MNKPDETVTILPEELNAFIRNNPGMYVKVGENKYRPATKEEMVVVDRGLEASFRQTAEKLTR